MANILSFRHKPIWQVPTLMPDLTIEDWLKRDCEECHGSGEAEDDFSRRACRHCGGTGEAYGFVCFAPCTGLMKRGRKSHEVPNDTHLLPTVVKHSVS